VRVRVGARTGGRAAQPRGGKKKKKKERSSFALFHHSGRPGAKKGEGTGSRPALMPPPSNAGPHQA